MTALQLKLHSFLEQYKEDSGITEKLSELQSIANKIDSEIDFLAWELRPSVLDNLGLSEAIRRYVNEWSLHFNIKAEFDRIGLNRHKLTPEIEINLYRIGQEALNNIAKHAGAKNVAVLLEQRDGEIIFIIEDNGTGFEPSKGAILTGDDRGMGLLGMKERAELVGGTFHMESSNGAGTTVYVRVPAQFEEAKK